MKRRKQKSAMRIALLTGGISSERDIALRSSETVATELRKNFAVEVFDFPKDIDRFLASRSSFCAAVPVFHGKGGEDGTVQGFLNTLGMPFIFSDVAAHALAMDKMRTKIVVADAGILTPYSRTVHRGESTLFERAVIVKPLDAGSSVGVTLANSQDELDRGLAEAFRVTDTALVEDFIRGEEFTVAVIDEGDHPVALPVIQIKSKKPLFDLESKYDPTLADEICPATISEALASRLQDAARRAHHAIGARHVSRSDFIVDANQKIWFLEINTIPGMTSASLLPKALAAAGKDFGDVLAEWIELMLRL